MRFEIVVVLFGLIGLYYFLSFSPVRMPSGPLTSPPQALRPEEPRPEPLSAESAPEPAAAVLPSASLPLAAEKKTAVALPESTSEPALVAAPAAAPQVVAAPAATAEAVVAQPSPPALTAPAAITAGASQQADISSLSAPVAPPRKAAIRHKPRLQALEVGAYVLATEVAAAAARLRELGLAFRTTTARRPTPMYRVFLGPFTDPAQIAAMTEACRRLGDKPFLRQVAGGSQVVVGSFYLQSSVVAWENLYHDAGLEPMVEQDLIELPQTLILLDDPALLAEADDWLAQLRAAGFAQARLLRGR
ncbi:MAG: SPOR domain-containing protein [Deltaproteobacteria bacterium]|nr:SPOR domain-containing protein [Deltaproteobacteria bacterium]